jgi:hypothetical protein
MPTHSSGSGTVTIPPEKVTLFVQQEVGLPSSFFLALAKSRILADGSLQSNYNYDNTQAPTPPPTTLEEAEAAPTPTTDG